MNIEKHLSEHTKIMFGPFFGEFGWEVLKWAPFIKWYRNKYQSKKIAVSTRGDRFDLYYNSADFIHTFKIKGDYKRFKPTGVECNLPGEIRKNIMNDIRNKYPNWYIFNPSWSISPGKSINKHNSLYHFEPRPSNSKKILDRLDGKIPIVISSRHRLDNNLRNWGRKRWINLFRLIEKEDKYVVFVAGKSPSYIKSSNNNFYNLESLVDEQTSEVGLSIAAINASRLVVSSQSGIVLLTNILKTPIIFWGDQIRRHSCKDNPLNNNVIGIEDLNYNIRPKVILEEISKFFKELTHE